MKKTIWMSIGILLLSGATLSSAQSLGDAARAARKEKPQQATSHHYDNDNLPTTEKLSVVGQTTTASNSSPSADTGSTPTATATTPVPAADPKIAEADRKKAADEWKEKLDAQKSKMDSLSKDLDLTQREYRLRAVAQYSDAGNRLRNSAQWDKEEADFKKQMDEKQKAVDAAKVEFENLQEQARKAGIRERE
jgi:hypothetical protein